MVLKSKKDLKWTTLQHNGIIFPPLYDVRGFTIRIKGETVNLTLDQEEMAYQWAKKKDTPYAQDKVFRKNFTADFVKTLDSKFKKVLYDEIDFSDVYEIVDIEKRKKEEEKLQARALREKIRDEKKRLQLEAKKKKKAAAGNGSKEPTDVQDSKPAVPEKKELTDAQRKKMAREKLKAEYGTAVVDGQKVEVGNYMAEPPGIFIGRGAHPLRGKWKPRITAKDVILNLDDKAKVPKGDWNKIVHNRESTWLASWADFLTGKTKYVWLADTAGLKQNTDKEKYEKAVNLEREIDRIENKIISDMKSTDAAKSKISTVCYLIYRTAMRVGDEKNSEEADTVGATTLRKEHITITENAIKFDFLGKDSVRWQETIPAQGDDKQFRDNLAKIIKAKKPKDEIFDKIKSKHVNQYYSSIVKGLSAKVFRTHLATRQVKKYLLKHHSIKDQPQYVKIHHGKLANLEAAVMCNHKRTIPKTFHQSLEKKRETLKKKEKERPWKKAQESLKKAKLIQPKTSKQKTQKSQRVRNLTKQIKNQKQRHKERLERLRLQIDLTDKTKDYNIGTSLRNYIDPRVFKTWTDEVGLEWEKLYTPALQKKFTWVKNENAEQKNLKSN